MYLVYSDETGTNFKEASPYLLYGGLIVHESKINILESQLEQMIAKFLKLDNVKKVELHTSEIFTILFNENFDCQTKRKTKDKIYCEELKKILKNVSIDDFINFTNELIQFLTKMNIPLMVSLINKTDEIHKKHRLNKEVSAVAYSFKMFLNLIDRFLASKNEKALLIVDNFENQIPQKLKNISFENRIKDENIISKNGAYKELVILRTLHESMLWKNTNNNTKYENIAPLKYEFESKSMFLLDNINYTNSKDSIMNQVADFMLFILKKSIDINNQENFKNKNILKFIKDIDRSLMWSLMNDDLQILSLKEDLGTDLVSSIGANFISNFKEICKIYKNKSNGKKLPTTKNYGNSYE